MNSPLIKGERALITGIDSFTGRYMADEMTAHGYEVFGTTQRVSDNPKHYTTDINDQARLTEIMGQVKPAVVLHLAAIAIATHGSSRDLYQTNLLGPLCLLESIAASGTLPRKVLLISSAHVYGNQTRSPINEQAPPVPASDYAVSKLAMEHAARLWFDRLPIIIVRPFNYTGVGQSLAFLLPKIVDHFARRMATIELGNTDVARDFSDVRDVVTVYRRLIESNASGVIVNTCSGVSHPLSETLAILQEASDHKIDVIINPAFVRGNDVKALWGDNQKLHELIGPMSYRPLQETLAWMYQTSQAALVLP